MFLAFKDDLAGEYSFFEAVPEYRLEEVGGL
jgi:hypothetical protein